jgi:hypothetical protein
MAAPILTSVYFGAGTAGGEFRRMARVLEYSALHHAPDWRRQVLEVPQAGGYRSTLGVPAHEHNSAKLDMWRDAIAAAVDGDRVVLIDADTMITGPLDDAWDLPFDIAYTSAASRLPFNAGVVFVRVSSGTRAFLEHWASVNRGFLRDAAALRPWRAKYSGINQAALGFMLERAAHGCTIARLPGEIWNCEDSNWTRFDPARTRIVHLKSDLRRAIFRGLAAGPVLAPIVAAWRKLEAAAVAGEARA